MEEKLEIIDNKSKKIKLYKVFDLFIRCILTFVGTVSLVSILMFLNSRFGVSYFNCFLIACIVPTIYSSFVNYSLSEFDKKIKKMEYELLEIVDEYDRLKEKMDLNEKIKNGLIEKIEFRFDRLSNERKLELLNYIKDVIPDCYLQYMDDFIKMDSISLDEIEKVIYSRKREK